MSFSRTIMRIKNRQEGKGLKVSIIDAIHEQVLAGERFNPKKAARLTKLLLKAITENHSEDAAEVFTELYGQIINMKTRAPHVFHPSSVEGDCPRMLWYDINKTPASDKSIRSFTPEIIMTFDQGTWFHHYVQNKLKKAGVLTKAEIPIVDIVKKISGAMDGDVWVPEEAGLEIKTMNSFQFKKAQMTNKPFPNHCKQAGVYGHVKGYKKIVFLYFNKDTSQMLEFHWDMDYKIIQPVLDKMDNILKSKKEPARMCADNKCERALQCSFRTHCFSKP